MNAKDPRLGRLLTVDEYIRRWDKKL